MVLIYKQELTHSIWCDFHSRCRSESSLEKRLRRGVRDGEWIGWRIISITKQAMGNEQREAAGGK